MGQNSDIQRIEARQQEIKAKMDELQKEANELETALMVFHRFSGTTGSKVSSAGAPRPSNLPTIFDMAVAVLEQAEDENKHGLTGREIVERIAGQFWPGVASTQILPSLYRFSKAGRMRKTKAGKFLTVDQGRITPNENGATAEAPEAKTGSVPSTPDFLNLQPSHRGA